MIESEFSLGNLFGAQRERRIIDITYDQGMFKGEVLGIRIKKGRLIFKVRNESPEQTTIGETSVSLEGIRFYENVIGQLEIIDANNISVFQLHLKARTVN